MCSVWNLLVVSIIAGDARGWKIIYPPGENSLESWPKGCIKSAEHNNPEKSIKIIDAYYTNHNMTLAQCIHHCRFEDQFCEAFLHFVNLCWLIRWKHEDKSEFWYNATEPEERYGLIRDCGFGDDPQCPEDNVQYHGNSSNNGPGHRGIKECFVSCKMSSKCFYWSYRHYSPAPNLTFTCTHFKMRDDITNVTFLRPSELPPGQTVASGAQYCRKDCLDEGFNYQHWDLTKVRQIYDARECRKECQKVDDCYFFSHNQISHRCYLKTKYALGGKNGDDKYVSGAKYNYCYNTCFERGKAVKGHDLLESPGFLVAQTVENCSQLCLENFECFYFTYYPDRKECYLKRVESIQDVISVKDVSVTSGSRFSRNCDGCYLESTQIVGQDISSVVAQSPDECRDRCSSKEDCKFFSYHMGRICELKTGNSKMVHNIYYTSGRQEGERDCRNECYTIGYKYFGGDTLRLNVSNADSCSEECQKRDNCEYFTFHIPTGTCHLKHLRQMFHGWNRTDHISGARYSRNCSVPPSTTPITTTSTSVKTTGPGLVSVTTPKASIKTTTIGKTIGSGTAATPLSNMGTLLLLAFLSFYCATEQLFQIL